MFAQSNQGQNLYQGHTATQAPVPTPPTLMRALSRSDELNGRLGDLSAAVQEIAIAIGGPWPCEKSGQGGKPAPDKPPVMEVLNDRLDYAHGRVSDIEQSLQAIRRTLGA
jgi:hypothetical protein